VPASQELRTARLLLRPVVPGDVDALHALLTDPAVRRHLLDGETVSRDFVARSIADSQAAFARIGCGLYAVHEADQEPLPGQRPLLGLCGFHLSGMPPERQLVYALAPAAWGQGYASEAVRAVIARARALRFKAIVATTDADNTASIAVLRACGFTPAVEVIERGRTVVRYVR
jgi:RimJ/RimL family protein N-acetyltransferase